MTKLRPLSRIAPAPKKAQQTILPLSTDNTIGLHILYEAKNHWERMHRFRQERERNKKYLYGDQWSDTITIDGKTMTEEEYIKAQGNPPLKNNLIRRLVRSVIGIYRQQQKEPSCTARDRDEQKLGETMSTVLQYNMQLNRMADLYARSMEEFLISGFIVHRKWYGWRDEKIDCWTDYVQPSNFFIDTNTKDFRGWDVAFCGEIHDIAFEELAAQFAKTPDAYNRLQQAYAHAKDRTILTAAYATFGENQQLLSFLEPPHTDRCRVYEIWRKEIRPRYRCHDPNIGEVFKVEPQDFEKIVTEENQKRKLLAQQTGLPEEEVPYIRYEWAMDTVWRFYYITPLGHIIAQGDSPYWHKSHPYAFKAYPFIDGEIHSFVSDFIDQQRYTNRLITMYDWMMRASAKGALLVHEEAIPEDMSVEDFADEWSRFNGVIVFRGKAGTPLPQQVASNVTNVGIHDLLNLQLKFFEDISGVQGSLQGKPGFAGMSASLYAQQTQNATTTLIDLLESFSQFIIDATYKDVKNIQQFYDTKRVFNIAGRASQIVTYNPNQIRDVEFDLAIGETTSTPAYRQIANDFLMEMWRNQAITIKQLLEHGDFPFADELLASIKQQEEEMQALQQQQPLPQTTPPTL